MKSQALGLLFQEYEIFQITLLALRDFCYHKNATNKRPWSQYILQCSVFLWHTSYSLSARIHRKSLLAKQNEWIQFLFKCSLYNTRKVMPTWTMQCEFTYMVDDEDEFMWACAYRESYNTEFHLKKSRREDETDLRSKHTFSSLSKRFYEDSPLEFYDRDWISFFYLSLCVRCV